MASFWVELRRRNVIRVGIAYLAVVWVLIQVADVVLPNVGGPAWILQALMASSALGFPLALVLAWFYELTPEGIKAAAEVEAVDAVRFMGRKLDFAIIGLLVIAVGFLVVVNYVVDEEASLERSIAALPFANESAAEENAEFFANGIHDELLTQLAKIGSLKVISRTSVMGYRDTEKSMREIGQELGVATLLEGRVQRAGDMIRINVQLIDASTDEHLWAEVYNRELTAENIFAIQGEMAISIAEALETTLSPEVVARLEEVPTQNTRALEFYLSGNDFMRRVGNRTNTPLAIRQFERAVEEDPAFVLAWAALARAHMVQYLIDDTDARLSMAEKALERAFQLAPESPEAYLARGRYHVGLNDFDSALEDYAIAERGMPGAAEISRQLAVLYGRKGDPEQAVIHWERAIERDPRNVELLAFQADAYSLLRDYTQAEKYYARALEMNPDCVRCFLRKAVRNPISLNGDANSAIMALDNPPTEIASFVGQQLQWRWLAALYVRDYDSALEHLDSEALDTFENRSSYFPKASFYGTVYHLADQPELAERQFQLAREQLEPELAISPEDFRLHVALGQAMAGLGNSEAALNRANRAIELLPANRRARGTVRYYLITEVLARAGQNEAAIEQLDVFLSTPGLWSIEGLLPDPRLDPIRNDPRFEALVEKYRRK
jgi:TolB-like protein/Tfp pilus assembly protein PilF